MLKRLDLAKQFELVVKQEIINYQNSLNFVLQSIGELKSSLKSIVEESLIKEGIIVSNNTNLYSQLQNLKRSHDDNFAKIHSHINDQRAINERNSVEFQDLSDAIIRNIQLNFKIKEKVEDINKVASNANDKCEKSQISHEREIDHLLQKLRKEIHNAKEDILARPSDSHLLKEQLEEKIASHSIDVQGLLKEIRVTRKEMFILEKKIENIYTLIERLQKA